MNYSVNKESPVKGNNYFIPFFVLLTLIGILNAIQYYNFKTNTSSVVKFLSISAANLIYSWYFLALLLLLPVFYRTFVRQKYFKWAAINLLILALFIFFHQLIAYTVDLIFLGKHTSKTFTELLVDNQAVWVDIVLYILFLFALYLIEFKKIVHEKELQQAELELDLIKTRLTELRVKIRPNFLFSTLDSIAKLVSSERFDDANQKLEMISDFLRTTIYDTGRDINTLDEEIHFLKLFVKIEQLTMENKITLEVKYEKSIGDLIVPTFILQPLVEDLFNYSTESSSISIELKIKKSVDNIFIAIKSNIRLPEDLLSKSEVIQYTHERLKRLCGNDYKLAFGENYGELHEIIIELPCANQELN